MLKLLAVAALTALLPAASFAELAPRDCTDHFVAGDLPEVGSARTPKTHLLCFSEYAVLHSGLSKTPVWSAEHLTSERIETAETLKRKNSFHAENALPESERAELSDYKGSGFDRGHMSPSGDMSTPKGQRESFSLANMIPQDPCSNEEQWEGIESAVRSLVKQEDEVFVVTGPIYPADADISQIGDGVLIPPQIFKAIYIPSLNAGAAYVAPNTADKEFTVVTLQDLKGIIDIDVFPNVAHKVKVAAFDLPSPEPAKFHCRVHSPN